jgi:hypothetical protein
LRTLPGLGISDTSSTAIAADGGGLPQNRIDIVETGAAKSIHHHRQQESAAIPTGVSTTPRCSVIAR